MTVDPTRASQPAATPGRPSNADQAATQFEEVLVKQFVQTMTQNLFTPMEGGPGWMGSQADQQRDLLADVLTQHLVEGGAMGIGDMMRRRWNAPVSDGPAPGAAPLPIDAPPEPLPARPAPLAPAAGPLARAAAGPLDLSA